MEANNNNPHVLFASCSSSATPDHIIEQMLGKLPIGITIESGVISYKWHVDTKYYSADVFLSALKKKSLTSQKFAESVQGIVLYFDSEMSKNLAPADEWLPYLKEYDSDIKILVCSQCLENSINGTSKREVQDWCLKREFELVELNPANDDSEEVESDFAETTGVNRIRQALHAHTWPNLLLKDRKEPTTMSGLLNGGRCKSTETDCAGLAEDNIEPSLEDICKQDKIDFCTLFGQLASMKERAANLPSDERKKFAEQSVLAYWNAIGGDEDEILDS